MRPATRADAERELERAAALGASVLAYGNSDYPDLLQEIADASPILYTMEAAASLVPRR